MTDDIYLCVRGKKPMPDEPTLEDIRAFHALKAFVKWSTENPNEDNLPVVENMLGLAYESGKNSLVVTPEDARRMIDVVIKQMFGKRNFVSMDEVAFVLTGWLRTL